MKEISYQSVQLDEFGDIIPFALQVEIDKAKKGNTESAKLLLKEFSNAVNHDERCMTKSMLQYFSDSIDEHLTNGIKLDKAFNLVKRTGRLEWDGKEADEIFNRVKEVQREYKQKTGKHLPMENKGRKHIDSAFDIVGKERFTSPVVA